MKTTRHETRDTSDERRATSHDSGFTFAECLIALFVTAMILAAVAVAFNAAFINYEQNSDIFDSINSARQALIRITAQLRTATSVNTTESSSQCTFNTADGQNITYQYNSSAGTLYLITNDDLSDDDYLLCENVTAMTFTKVLSAACVKNVQISITVRHGGTEKTLATAVVIRKNLK